MTTKPISPKWSTPERRQQLVKLFLKSKGFCIYGHSPCPYPEHHYDLYIEGLIIDWIAEDKAEAIAQWHAELDNLHRTAERTEPIRGRFSAISRDIWHSQQPLYYLEGYGISGVVLTPFAKVRIAGGYVNLFVDLGDSLREVSKNKKRKAIRYGKPLPKNIQENIRQQVVKAVLHYLNH